MKKTCQFHYRSLNLGAGTGQTVTIITPSRGEIAFVQIAGDLSVLAGSGAIYRMSCIGGLNATPVLGTDTDNKVFFAAYKTLEANAANGNYDAGFNFVSGPNLAVPIVPMGSVQFRVTATGATVACQIILCVNYF